MHPSFSPVCKDESFPDIPPPLGHHLGFAEFTDEGGYTVSSPIVTNILSSWTHGRESRVSNSLGCSVRTRKPLVLPVGLPEACEIGRRWGFPPEASLLYNRFWDSLMTVLNITRAISLLIRKVLALWYNSLVRSFLARMIMAAICRVR